MLTVRQIISSITSFQSLSGFLMRCDGSFRSDVLASLLFQSLSGFLMRCDEGGLAPPFQGLSRFNPYRVF